VPWTSLELEVDLVAHVRVEVRRALDRELRLHRLHDAAHVLLAHEGDAAHADEVRVLGLGTVGLDGGVLEAEILDALPDGRRLDRLREPHLHLGAAREVDAEVEAVEDRPQDHGRVRDEREHDRDLPLPDEVELRVVRDDVEGLELHQTRLSPSFVLARRFSGESA